MRSIDAQIFDKASIFNRLKYSYNDEPLAKKLRAEFNGALRRSTWILRTFADSSEDRREAVNDGERSWQILVAQQCARRCARRSWSP